MKCKSFPLQSDLFPVSRWAQTLIRDSTDIKAAELLKEYQDVLLSTVKSDPASLNFVFYLIKRYWLVYFYPKIYSKHIPPSEQLFIENVDIEAVGYQPHCAPLVHVFFRC
eukprot:TRINITY_DN22371_c0_g1_i1.p1 TRINITY_DN22371_c0_g1~~TRINITY_DN22371_c0_g1_i1.p1  ORF type:complete len:110 (-),score=10.00 TRINITY_DN22371_c0_g1_i1:168-497(-)